MYQSTFGVSLSFLLTTIFLVKTTLYLKILIYIYCAGSYSAEIYDLIIRLGFKNEEIKLINGPVGIKLGGKSPSEIALSIVAQLVSEKYKN